MRELLKVVNSRTRMPHTPVFNRVLVWMRESWTEEGQVERQMREVQLYFMHMAYKQ